MAVDAKNSNLPDPEVLGGYFFWALTTTIFSYVLPNITAGNIIKCSFRIMLRVKNKTESRIQTPRKISLSEDALEGFVMSNFA